jgi:hypothetical protein
MSKLLQKILLAVGVIALVVLVVEIVLSLAATTHGSTPKKVLHVTAGPYALAVSLYDDPANAGFALPFAIVPQQPAALSYAVSSVPGHGVHATPVRAALSRDPHSAGGIQGTAEITVQGPWALHVIVDGPAGRGVVNVPVRATAPAALWPWLGWSIGLVPFFGLILFLLLQTWRRGRPAAEQAPLENAAAPRV